MAEGRVTIKCPVTGKPVYTGMSMDPETFRKKSFEETKLVCPHCGQEHTWDKRNAYLNTEETGQTSSSSK